MSSQDVEAILISLTLEEKISLLAGGDFYSTTRYSQKKVPTIKTADDPKEVRSPDNNSDIRSACFPAACSLAAAFDTDIAFRVGTALAEEAQAMNVNCVLGPTVCIHRHPLGGRNFESFSDDPLLTGKMASEVIQGLQKLGVAATIKHFVANEQETARTSVNETISERALREIYLRPFEIAIKEANPWALMTACNLVNGTHCDSHEWLLREILRTNWGWNGFVMSDWGGTNLVIDALNAGLNLEMPGTPRDCKLTAVLQAVDSGSVSQFTIDDRVRGVLRLALKLNSFGAPAPTNMTDSPEHQRLIREAGSRGIVLLKNDDSILPLLPEKARGKRIALIGFARHALAHGGGSASLNTNYKIKPEMGLEAALGDDVDFSYSQGARRERLLLPLSSKSSAGPVTGLDGSFGFTFALNNPGLQGPKIVRQGLSASEYLPLGSNESYQHHLEISGDFTPAETGLHYMSSPGFGPTQVYIDDQLVFEQKRNTQDPMGTLFKAAPEPEFRHQFVAGKAYRIRVCSETPVKIGLEVLEVRSGARLGFSLELVHDADLKGAAMQVAADADYAIIFTGHDSQWETEGQDQASFQLPNNQNDLIMAVSSVNKNAIVVNFTGVAVAMPWLDQIKGVLQAWFPG